MLEHIQQNLQRAQHRMKSQADNHRQERHFEVGDWVSVKLQPYVQHSVQRRVKSEIEFQVLWPLSDLTESWVCCLQVAVTGFQSDTPCHPRFPAQKGSTTAGDGFC